MDDALDKTVPEQPSVEENPQVVSEETVSGESEAAEASVEQPSESEVELARLAAECEMLKDKLLRARAEFDNHRKRVLREGEQARIAAAQGIVRDLLPVADNLERALAHAEDPASALAEGVRMVLRQFMDVLAARGLAAIPAIGVPFDPNVHEALSYMPSDEHEAGMVMNEFERGYCLGSAVLRPSRVVVSSGMPEAAAIEEEVNPTEPDAAKKRP
jgi:molecular chaperone GrpE